MEGSTQCRSSTTHRTGCAPLGPQPGQEGVQRLLALPLRRQGEGRVGPGAEGEQRCKQRYRLRQDPMRPCGFQRAQLAGRIVVIPAQEAVQMIDDG